jgi:thiosulfate reductase cytochrome b subunit
MKNLQSKHPLAIRWFHWVNFPVLALMVWSGLKIYRAYDVYRIGFGSWTLLRIDKEFLSHLGITQGLAVGMAWHFLFGWIFAVNGALYVGYLVVSGAWRHILPNRSSLKEAWQVVLHDLRIRKEPLPKAKFNGAQKIAYTGVVLLGFIALASGLAIYKPVQLAFLLFVFGGYQGARFVHFWVCMLFVLFFVVHIVQVTRAGWNNFRSMITGREIVIGEQPNV